MFIVTGLAFGGAERQLLRLLSHLDRAAFDPIVFVLSDDEAIQPEIERLGIEVRHPVPNGRAGLFRILLEAIRLVRSRKPDQIQGWMLHGNAIATVIGLLTGVPFGWSVRHSFLPKGTEKRATRILERLLALTSRLPRAVAYNSKLGRRLHEDRGYYSRRSVVIPNGIDIPSDELCSQLRTRIRRLLSVGQDQILVGNVGRYHPTKDIDTFLNAAARLADKCATVRFVMIGPGFVESNKALSAAIFAHDLGGKLDLLGPRSDATEFLPALDIFVSSSISEAFSNVIAEAMSNCVPCVVTDVGDSAWLVGSTGIVVEPGRPDAICDACMNMIESGAERRRQLGQLGRERIRDHFSIDRFVSEMEAFLLSVSNPVKSRLQA